jgi:hypothetical protein
MFYFLREVSTSRQKQTSKPGHSVCPLGHHRPVDSCRSPAQGGCSHAPSSALTYSTRWGWTQPAGRRCAHWALGRARGTPGAHACSSCRCPSRPSAARCQRFGASGCLHSRCYTQERSGHENHLTAQKKLPTNPPKVASSHQPQCVCVCGGEL